ncbi:GNAT family N-acetyltransferase [Ideonella sp. BN130291]|uniref:GNAT family N-acetyltransferase n=1 Tax=Ideonella sp. BN130291 TaxID=3112940 RepID=UPI002E272E7B|nr:GNAT family N-acetyltransferase [Ideonella sp. BN130291]
MIELAFRTATADDALCLGVLGTQVFLDTYATGGIRPSLAREVLAHFSTEAMARLLAAPDTVLLLAESQAHLVGFAQLAPGKGHARVQARAPVELARLYVQEPFTGRGVGRALLQQAEARMAAQGADVMWLTAWVGNARALAFYPRQGYREQGVTSYEFEGEAYENRLFAKPLGPGGGDGAAAARQESPG